MTGFEWDGYGFKTHFIEMSGTTQNEYFIAKCYYRRRFF